MDELVCEIRKVIRVTRVIIRPNRKIDMFAKGGAMVRAGALFVDRDPLERGVGEIPAELSEDLWVDAVRGQAVIVARTLDKCCPKQIDGREARADDVTFDVG